MKSLNKIFYFLTFLLLIWILILNLNVNQSSFYWLNSVITVVSILSFLTFFFIKLKFSTKEIDLEKVYQKNSVIKVLYWLAILILIGVMGQLMRVKLNWDFGTVHINAFSIAKTGKYLSIDYFARYPNNNVILLFLVFCYKVIIFFFNTSSIEESYTYMIFINAFIIWLGIFFSYRIIRENFSQNYSFIALFSMIFTLPTLFYANIFYTDTVGFFFVAFVLWLMGRYSFSCDHNKKIMLLIVIGVMIAVGYKIKAFVAILLVAFILNVFFNSKDRWLSRISNIICLIISFLATLFLIGLTTTSIIPVSESLSNENELPLTHWIAMGLNEKTNGGFNQMDYNNIKTFPSYKSKNEEAQRIIKRRIDSRGVIGTSNFVLFSKWTRTWADGDFATKDYGLWDPARDGIIQHLLRNRSISFLFQFTWFFILVLIAVGTLFFNKKTDVANISYYSFFGFVIFLSIWECNSRYVYCFIPIIVVMVITGIRNIKSIITRK
ncbi:MULTISPECIES: glycosyltransferase family 39 protein [Enterococcus]|uniref:glycosyltransferase family 39 protein n=1 Tax=Enterococcus TaxID=1350 RepID=UPI0026EC33BA|nr:MULTISPECIES: glycosyltransferase family 39 protein [Enterococcus]MDT2738574.1 glycosyltransferase family 39 protein [Enterococcus canintestini]